jgi:hypothetical protein
MLAGMSHLRLVPPVAPLTGAADATTSDDDRPRVSLRLLMAMSGRCSCDECLIAYRAGDRNAGVIDVPPPARRLRAVR